MWQQAAVAEARCTGSRQSRAEPKADMSSRHQPSVLMAKQHPCSWQAQHAPFSVGPSFCCQYDGLSSLPLLSKELKLKCQQLPQLPPFVQQGAQAGISAAAPVFQVLEEACIISVR